MSTKHLITAACTSALAVVTILLFADPDSKGLHFLAKLTILLATVGSIAIWSLNGRYGWTKTKRLLATLMLIGLSTGTSLILAELFLRYAFRDVTTTEDNSSYFAQRWRRTHPPITNSWGFRERQLSTQNREGSYRIAVIGDSFTYGQGISKDARLTEILESRLNQSAMDYEVVNFGKPGAETIDHIKFLDDFVFRVSPDYILLQWFLNDVEGHDKSRRPTSYRLLPSDFLTGYLHRHSALYYLINATWVALQVKLGLVGTYEAYMVTRFRDPNSEDSRAANDALREFMHKSIANDIPVGVVIFPALVETHGLVENYPLGFLADRVLETCREERVPCLDLRSVFAPVSPASKLWANRLDSHPGRIANEMAAEAVLRAFATEWGPR